MPAGAGAHDHRDLRDHARGVHVAAEDLAVQAERDDALLDAGAGALVDADDRAAGLDGEVHHLGDLLAVDLAERAAEDREVLGEHAHLAAVDGAVAGDHAVAVRAVLLQAERDRAVPGQLVELDERALVEEQLDPLAGGLAALGVLLLDRLRRARVDGLVEAPVQVGELAGRRVDVDVRGDVGALAGLCTHAARWLLVGVRLGPWANVVPVTSDADATPITRPARRSRRSPPTWSVEVLETTTVDQRGRRRARPRRCARGAGRRRRAPDRRPRPAGPHLGDAAGSALTSRCVLRPTVPPARWPWLPLLTGYAVGKALARARVRRRGEVAQRRAHRRAARSPASWSSGSRRPTARPRSSASASTSRLTADELPVPTGDLAGDRVRRRARPDRAAGRRARLAARGVRRLAGRRRRRRATRLRASYAAACVTVGPDVRSSCPAARR